MKEGLRPIARPRLAIDTVSLARQLIGTTIVRELPSETLIGSIVETEAYPPGDPASHAYKGRTPRCGSMFLPPGHAYVYVAYGISFMLNVSAEDEGVGAAVLVRAVEPLRGLSTMKVLRASESLRNLARGPGRLAQAFAIDRSLDGMDLTQPGSLWLAAGESPSSDIGTSKRIGVTRNTEQPWRFFIRGSPFVSGAGSLSR